MRFTKPFWDRIADGRITVAYRGWNRPTVVIGRTYRTGGGRIEVDSVERIAPGDITDADAASAGYASADEVLTQVRTDGGRALYKVEFHRLDEPDPREQLAGDTTMDEVTMAEIGARLDRLDRASSFGPWTRPTLHLIGDHPGRRAPDLAELVGRETKPFKLDVRKLKNLGLTISLRIGYELSPRGQAYLDAIGKTRGP